MEMAQLNSHLFQIQKHDTPACSCGFKTENVNHFIVTCPNYNLHREEFFRSMLQVSGGNFTPTVLKSDRKVVDKTGVDLT